MGAMVGVFVGVVSRIVSALMGVAKRWAASRGSLDRGRVLWRTSVRNMAGASAIRRTNRTVGLSGPKA